MDAGSLVLLRCRVLAAGNLLRAAFARGRRLDSSVVALGGGLLLAYWSATLLERLSHLDWCRTQTREFAVSLLAFAGSSGLLAGHHDAHRVRRLANAAFLSVLPWSENKRRYAMRLACAPGLCAGMLYALGSVYAAADRCDLPDAALLAGAMAALFGCTFALIAFHTLEAARGQRPAYACRVAGGRKDTVLRAAERFDRGKPKWLGSWALGRRATALAAAWSFIMITLGIGAATGGMLEQSAGPVVAAAVLGGHIVFLLGLRAGPLVSNALRVEPVSFLGAVWGVTRLPLLASIAWFCLPALSAFAATEDPSGQVAAGGASLLLLDAMFVVIAVSLPKSPRTALLLHCGTLAIAAQNLARFGAWAEAILLIAFLAHRLRSARSAFLV